MARNNIKAHNKRKGSNLKTGRDYSYDKKYESSPEQIRKRASRNRARREAMKSGRVHKYDGRDVDHKNGNPLDNRKSNLRIESKKKNRGRKK